MTAESLNPGFGVGTVPRRLEIEGRPELSDFPLNVVFVNPFSQNGVQMMATAVYIPELETYVQDGDKKSMRYSNQHDIAAAGDKLTITKDLGGWKGVKVIAGKEALMATGVSWGQFFTQLTYLGLAKGERCKFERL